MVRVTGKEGVEPAEAF